MSYQRVIPRDLFNEAKLLKCLGKLSLLALDKFLPIEVVHEDEDFPGFQVEQDQDDGSIYAANVRVVAKDGRELTLRSPLNSRRAWPLLFVDGSGDFVAAFHDDGTPTNDFCDFVTFGGTS